MAPPVISLTELLMPRSAQQVINDFFSYLANPPDPTLVSVRTANWRTGGPYRFLAYRQGIEASLLYQVLAGFAGSAFLRYATGRWLDWLGQDFFDEPRQDAQFATAILTVNVPAGAGPYGPLQLQAQTTDGKTFLSEVLVTLPAGPASTLVAVKATTAGSTYNVGPNTITQLVTPNVLGVSVTNAAAATGGFDMEPDDRYRQRLAAKWGALSRGTTEAAYIYYAMSASPEVVKVKVNSDQHLGVFESQWITVIVGTAIGPVSTDALAAVDARLQSVRPIGSKLMTENAVALPYTVTGPVQVYSPYVSTAHGSIATSLQSLSALVPIGGYPQGGVPASEVQRAVIYDPTQVYDAQLTNPAPAAVIAPAYNELLVLVDGTTVSGV